MASDDPHEPIWDLPGLLKNEFYAATYFLSHQQRQQGGDEYLPEESRTPAPLRTLLDALALLFARAKGAGTAANVTAVAAEVRSGEGRGLVFHVAKNGGPQMVEGLGDESFADTLAAWHNTPDEGRTPRPDSEVWLAMIRFWNQRLRTYLQTIDRSRTLTQAKDELEEQFRDTGPADLEAFHGDFETVLRYADARHEDIAQRVFHMSFQLPDVSDHRYPKNPAPPKGKRDTRSARQKNAEKFRKTVKHIKLLRTLRVAWEQFVALRDDYGNAPVSIVFQPRRDPLPLPIEPIVSAMKAWQAPSGGKSTFAQDVNAVAQSLARQGSVRNRFFHCELQLLELCITAPHPGVFQDYFGCSKLSCALCWYVMKDADYQTKGTHARLYPDCAFPFGVSSADGHCRLGVALKRAQDQLQLRILRYSMHPDDQFTQYVSRTETNPYAATIHADDDPDNRIEEWLSERQGIWDATEVMDVPMLKLSPDGRSSIVSIRCRNLFGEKLSGIGRRFATFEMKDRIAWRPGHDTTQDKFWTTDLHRAQLWRQVARKIVMLERCPTYKLWQWSNFRIALDRHEKLHAEIQVLFRPIHYRPHKLPPNNPVPDWAPVNRFCVREVGFWPPRRGRYPWRGELFIAGQIVLDDGTQNQPHIVRSLNHTTMSEFLELFREIVRWTSWYEVTHEKRLWDEAMDAKGPGVQKKEFSLATPRPAPSAEAMKKWWALSLADLVFGRPWLTWHHTSG